MGITREQALDCLASDDLIGMGMEADAVRRRLHPEGVVSYAIEGEISTSEIGMPSTAMFAADLDEDRLRERLDDLRDGGGTGCKVVGDSRHDLSLTQYVTLLRALRRRAPELSLEGLHATEIVRMAAQISCAVRDVLLPLHEAGLDALGGDDAGVLDTSVRERRFPLLCSVDDWLEVHRTAHSIGMPTSAAMRFGAGETMEQRVQHLELLGDLQKETAGFTAFALHSLQPGAGDPGNQDLDEATSVEFLKTLAVSRMVLDNFDHVQTSGGTQGLKVLQMGLRFGSDDAGVLPPQAGRMVSKKAAKGTTEEELRRVIRDAGFVPVQRDALYRTMFLNA